MKEAGIILLFIAASIVGALIGVGINAALTWIGGG